MVTSSTTQAVVWIILWYNTKEVNDKGPQMDTLYVVPISLMRNQVIAKVSPTLDLTDHFIKYNTAIQDRKKSMFYVKAVSTSHTVQHMSQYQKITYCQNQTQKMVRRPPIENSPQVLHHEHQDQPSPVA